MSSDEENDEEMAREEEEDEAQEENESSRTMVMTLDENPFAADTSSSKPRYEIVSTRSPLGGFFHPTHATVKDNETGEIFEWNSRMHRKLRHVLKSKEQQQQQQRLQRRHLPRIWTCEPYIVTWWLNVTNEIANVFWTISGLFATWPSLSDNADTSSRIVYAAGIIAGVFLIASCYLSYVEAINHSHADIVLPTTKDDKNSKRVQVYTRRFVRPQQIYGMHRSPLGEQHHGIDEKKRQQLLRMGFPIVERATTSPKRLITMDMFDEAIESSHLTNDETLQALQVKVNLSSSKYVCTTQAIHIVPMETDSHFGKRSYMWWTWTPALNHLGVLCGLIGFLSAIVYLIPMCMGYPLAKNDHPIPGRAELFFVDILQVIPYICFAAIGHLYIAEAAGSWWKPKLDSIGWWITVFNTVGAYGFLFCGAFAIPGTVGSTCCPNMGRWGSALSCFWGACAYLVGGLLMMIEFANPEPIVVWGSGGKAQNDKKGQEKHT